MALLRKILDRGGKRAVGTVDRNQNVITEKNNDQLELAMDLFGPLDRSIMLLSRKVRRSHHTQASTRLRLSSTAPTLVSVEKTSKRVTAFHGGT
jgi:hypothetical protein